MECFDEVDGDSTGARRRKLSNVQSRRRKIAALLATLAGVLILVSRSAWAEGVAVEAALRAAGMAALAVGVLGRVWASLFIGDRKLRELVRAGPYAVVRHPLYLFTAIACAGVGLFHGSLLIGVGFFLCCWAGFSLVAAREEEALAASFGAPWEAYRREVPPFLPRFRRPEGTATVEVSLPPVWRAMRESALFFIAPPALLLLDALQAKGVAPVLLSPP